MDKNPVLTQFIKDIPNFIKAANEFWGEEKKTGDVYYLVKCPEHGVIMDSTWFKKEDWESHSAGIKFCHFCGKELVTETNDIIQKHYGEGNLQLLFWDEGYRANMLAELTGQPNDKVQNVPQGEGTDVEMETPKGGLPEKTEENINKGL